MKFFLSTTCLVIFFVSVKITNGFSQVICIEYVNFSSGNGSVFKSRNIVFHSNEKSVSYTLPYQFTGTGLINIDESQSNGKRNSIYVSPSDTIRKYVFKNFAKSEMSFQAPLDIFYKENKVFLDSLHNFKWVLIDEEKQIDSFRCKKATVSFRNRNYIAWFCEEIPLNNGPWKFGGLPGLIIEIEDSEKIVFWRVERIFKTDYRFPAFPLVFDGFFADYKKEFKEKFIKFKKTLEASDNLADPNCGGCSSSRTVISNTPEKLAN